MKKRNVVAYFVFICCKKLLAVSPPAVRLLLLKLRLMLTGKVYTTDREEFLKVVPTHRTASARWWQRQSCWQAKVATPERYNRLAPYIETAFAPQLSKDFTVCDLACASGDFSFLIADRVKQVEAFDLSADMIGMAKETAAKMGIKNVDFRQAAAERLQLPADRYDAFMMLGLLTYIDIPNAAAIVKNVGRSMKPQAKLIVKDSITHNTSAQYVYVKSYVAYYRTEKEYLQLFEGNGFRLLHSTYLEARKGSIAAIFEKA
ncbi:MAG: class I SAM-dependent methyltransferase [Prevotellaceae bacterium]|jgi:2-polyprenyl-3-methyl-5-hydroxy-6-metoxy-1,4-benzoquinol methylase|nr:class I SAM-dependent methyltransferase [Prevotellaceae bacterium]